MFDLPVGTGTYRYGSTKVLTIVQDCSRIPYPMEDSVWYSLIIYNNHNGIYYVETGFRLCCMCAATKVFAAKAARRDSSPAMVAAAITLASC